MNDLEKRKKLLVAECEVYRQTLKLEIQNLKIYGIRFRRRLASPAAYVPLMLAVYPMVRQWFGGRKRRTIFGRLARSSFYGWQAFRRFSPLVQRLFSARPARPTGWERTPRKGA